MNNKKKLQFTFIVLSAVLIVAALVSVLIGRYEIDLSHIKDDTNIATVLFNIRLPRIALACMVGAALSVSGTAYQGVFQNALASPDILGASSGAAFGAALAILLGGSTVSITLSAFFFSLLTVFLSWLISTKGRGRKVLLLVLSGIIVGSLFNAGTSYLKLVADPQSQLQEITYWLMGSLAGAKKTDLLIAGIPMIIGAVPLILLRWKINLLTLGDEEAKTLGINVDRIRIIVICCSTLLTAAAVSVSGMIGWVGLVIPHLCRKFVGNNYKQLIPASLITGAIFLLIVDDICRNLLSVEIPIGILTAFVGAPFFMFILIKRGDEI